MQQYPILGFLVRVRQSVDLSMESSGGSLEEALIVLSLRVDDGYRMVTFGGRLRERREIGGAGYSQLFEGEAQPCSEMAPTACTPNLSTFPVPEHPLLLSSFDVGCIADDWPYHWPGSRGKPSHCCLVGT